MAGRHDNVRNVVLLIENRKNCVGTEALGRRCILVRVNNYAVSLSSDRLVSFHYLIAWIQTIIALGLFSGIHQASARRKAFTSWVGQLNHYLIDCSNGFDSGSCSGLHRNAAVIIGRNYRVLILILFGRNQLTKCIECRRWFEFVVVCHLLQLNKKCWVRKEMDKISF